jgi:hypothetical protein
MTTAIIASALLILGSVAVAHRPVKKPVPLRVKDRA